MRVLVETGATDPAPYAASVQAVTKLSAEVELVAPGSLPNDGKVIEDQREYRT
jgi:phenylacetate-CoA ligase